MDQVMRVMVQKLQGHKAQCTAYRGKQEVLETQLAECTERNTILTTNGAVSLEQVLVLPPPPFSSVMSWGLHR